MEEHVLEQTAKLLDHSAVMSREFTYFFPFTWPVLVQLNATASNALLVVSGSVG
jgi:hypothetical protein